MIFLILGILLALVVAIAASRRTTTDQSEQETANQEEDRPDDCCGAHEVCESDSLLRSNDQVEYYEDEELDVFKGTDAGQYNDDQIEQFREVLYTLQEREVAGWLKSLQIRGVQPPNIIREEALMIVAERRGI